MCYVSVHPYAPNLRSVSFALTSLVPHSTRIRLDRPIKRTTMINTAIVTNDVATEIGKMRSSNRKELEGDVVYAYLRHVWEGLRQRTERGYWGCPRPGGRTCLNELSSALKRQEKNLLGRLFKY